MIAQYKIQFTDGSKFQDRQIKNGNDIGYLQKDLKLSSDIANDMVALFKKYGLKQYHGEIAPFDHSNVTEMEHNSQF